MLLSLASLLSPKLVWSVFGHPVDIPLGKSDNLASALRVPAKTELTLVSVKCIRADSVCVPVSTLVVLPGAGEPVTEADKCCCNEQGLLFWNVLPDTQLPFIYIGSGSLSQLVKQNRRLNPRGASLTLGNVQLNGSVLSAYISAYWSENVAGIEIVLIDQTFQISVDFGVQNPYPIHIADIEGPFGIPISVDGNISVRLNPNQVCAELRASWPGGNVQGPHGCQGF